MCDRVFFGEFGNGLFELEWKDLYLNLIMGLD